MLEDNIQIKDLNRSLLEEIKNDIMPYSVALFGIKEVEERKPLGLLGSGTLIKYNQYYGILTACHVLESSNFKDSTKIGFILDKDINSFTISPSFLEIIKDRGITGDPKCPDIAFIILPQNVVLGIQAKKSFWEVQAKAEGIPDAQIISTIGLWSTSGCIDEYTLSEVTASRREKTFHLRNLVGFAGMGNYQISGNYDYMDILVSYDPQSESPASFGGLSGGGIWHTVLRRNEGGQITHDRPQLMGLAFYQSAIENGERKILCHGPISIYKTLPALVDNSI